MKKGIEVITDHSICGSRENVRSLKESVYPTLQSRTHIVMIRGVHRRVIVVIIEHGGVVNASANRRVARRGRKDTASSGWRGLHPTGLNGHAVTSCVVVLEASVS